MEDENRAGKIILFLDPEGIPTGVGYYHRWGDPNLNAFKQVSEHSVAWDTIPGENLSRAVHRCLGIPVVED